MITNEGTHAQTQTEDNTRHHTRAQLRSRQAHGFEESSNLQGGRSITDWNHRQTGPGEVCFLQTDNESLTQLRGSGLFPEGLPTTTSVSALLWPTGPLPGL